MSDLRYTNREFTSIRDGMLADVQNKTPELTNLNPGEPAVALIEVLAAALDIQSYSIDRNVAEVFLDTAISQTAVQRIGRALGYVMRRRTAATATVRFTLNQVAPSNITIPAGTVVATTAGVQFVTRDDAVILTGASVVDVVVYEGARHVESFTGTGEAKQSIQLLYGDVADNVLDITVDGVPWSEDRNDLGTNPSSLTLYRADEDYVDATTVAFSKYLGTVPAAGSTITATYLSTNAEIGNVGAATITNLISQLTLPNGISISVTNSAQAQGGRERESVEEARVNIPRSFSNRDRAVTLLDYINIIKAQPGVDDATAVNHLAFVECYVRLAKVNGAYPTFKVEPPILNVPVADSTGGSIAGNTPVTLALTYVLADGTETNAQSVVPSSGFNAGNPQTITTPAGTNTCSIQISVPTPLPAGMQGYNLYVSTASGMRRVNNALLTDADLYGTNHYLLTTLVTSGALIPDVNLAGAVSPITGRSYYQDIYDVLTARRTLGTSFELFATTAVPVNLDLRIIILDTYSRAAVQTAVLNALTAFFATRPLGQPLYLADVMQAVLAVTGVRTTSITNPLTNVGMAAGQYPTLGAVTLTMQGGAF